jgi:hypothetical protein
MAYRAGETLGLPVGLKERFESIHLFIIENNYINDLEPKIQKFYSNTVELMTNSEKKIYSHDQIRYFNLILPILEKTIDEIHKMRRRSKAILDGLPFLDTDDLETLLSCEFDKEFLVSIYKEAIERSSEKIFNHLHSSGIRLTDEQVEDMIAFADDEKVVELLKARYSC